MLRINCHGCHCNRLSLAQQQPQRSRSATQRSRRLSTSTQYALPAELLAAPAASPSMVKLQQVRSPGPHQHCPRSSTATGLVVTDVRTDTAGSRPRLLPRSRNQIVTTARMRSLLSPHAFHKCSPWPTVFQSAHHAQPCQPLPCPPVRHGRAAGTCSAHLPRHNRIPTKSYVLLIREHAQALAASQPAAARAQEAAAALWASAVAPFAVFGDDWVLNVLFFTTVGLLVFSLLLSAPKQ